MQFLFLSLSRKLFLSLIPKLKEITLVIVEKRHNFNYPRPVEVSSGLSGTQFSYASHITISIGPVGGIIFLSKLPGRRHIFIFPGGDGTSGTSSHMPRFNPSGSQTRGLIE